MTMRERFLLMIRGHMVAQAIHVAAKLEIADLIDQGVTSSEDIAVATGANEENIYRLLRALASIDVFEEKANREFGLTEMSKLLRKNVPGSFHDIAAYYAFPPNYLSWSQFEAAIKDDEHAFVKEFGEPIFDYYNHHHEYSAVFNHAMMSLTRLISDSLISKYDIPENATVMDVGGGFGQVLESVLAANHSAKGIVVDQEKVIEQARAKGLLKKFGDRAQYLAGNFFKAIPEGADIVILKHILHDWNDKDCIRILKTCRNAMAVGAKLLVIDSVLSDDPKDKHPIANFMDLHMMVLLHAKERTQNDFEHLFAQSGFQLQQIVKLNDSVSIVEAIAN